MALLARAAAPEELLAEPVDRPSSVRDLDHAGLDVCAFDADCQFPDMKNSVSSSTVRAFIDRDGSSQCPGTGDDLHA